MNHAAIISQLQKNASSFAGQLLGVSQEEYLWKPAPEKWCLLELVCHLVDEENEDFRQRVQTTLESPGQAPPAIGCICGNFSAFVSLIFKRFRGRT